VNEASLSESGDGRWILAGNLDFATVPQVWPALERVLGLGQPVKLSLGQVDHANSAGLVLLIEALDVARRSGSTLSLADIPGDLLDLARMSSCEALITAA
jgi:phospholipid transport system transporter-binding protein